MINRRTMFFYLNIIIPCSVVILFTYIKRDYQLDDALIYLRYIKNFHEGFGLVYNHGEKFNGLTSPLYTYIVLVTSFLFKDLQLTTNILSATFFSGAAIIGGKIFSEGKWEAILTSVVIGSFGYFYTTFGMETPLFLMLVAFSLYLYKIKSDYFVLTLALLIATRNEGIFLAIPLTADYLIKNRTLPNIKILLISVIFFLFPFIFNYYYYGDFLPATGNAKIDQGRSGFWGSKWAFFNIKQLIDDTFLKSFFAPYFLLTLSAFGIFSLLKNKLAIIILVYISLLLYFYIDLNIPNYHWYYAPFFYVFLLFSCRGFKRLSTTLLSKGAFDDRAFIFWSLCILVIFSLTKTISFEKGDSHGTYVRIGNWIKHNTPPEASVAMVEIGTIGWYADRTIIDLLGLVNKYNADYIGKRDLWSWLTRYQPDYILRHDPSPWIFEESTKALESNGIYARVSEFNISEFALLKKTSKYPDVEIAQMAEKVSSQLGSSPATLNEMAMTSEIGHPQVYLDKGILFASAPSSLSLILKKPAKSITISYGITENAENLHFGVCFEIVKQSNNDTIMNSCIDASTIRSQLHQHKTLAFNGAPREKLIFKTLCKTSCNYAWSYWKEVTFNP